VTRFCPVRRIASAGRGRSRTTNVGFNPVTLFEGPKTSTSGGPVTRQPARCLSGTLNIQRLSLKYRPDPRKAPRVDGEAQTPDRSHRGGTGLLIAAGGLALTAAPEITGETITAPLRVYGDRPGGQVMISDLMGERNVKTWIGDTGVATRESRHTSSSGTFVGPPGTESPMRAMIPRANRGSAAPCMLPSNRHEQGDHHSGRSPPPLRSCP
jgi:hypothetical protein